MMAKMKDDSPARKNHGLQSRNAEPRLWSIGTGGTGAPTRAEIAPFEDEQLNAGGGRGQVLCEIRKQKARVFCIQAEGGIIHV